MARVRDTKRWADPVGLRKTPEYLAWLNMRSRCLCNKHAAFHNYGGRGVSICAEWDTFEVFLVDMGNRPGPEYSLDRVDNNGDYSKANCVWATRTTQSRNRRDAKLDADKVNEIRGRWEHGESQLSIAARFGVSRGTICDVVCRKTWKDVP